MTVLRSCCVFGQQFVNLLADALQRFAAGGYVDVDDTANLSVIDFSGRVDLPDIRHGAQRHVSIWIVAADQRRLHRTGLPGILHRSEAWRPFAMQRDVLKVFHRHVVDPVIAY